jgi:hypothetical protein
MNTKQWRVSYLFLALSLLGPIHAPAQAGSEVTASITGKALFSFTMDYFFIQTDRYVYKIRKAGLSEELQAKLERASLQSELVQVPIPRAAIDFLWPANFDRAPDRRPIEFQKLASDLKSEVKTGDGQVKLTGTIALSFSEGFFLVEVNKAVYQIRKSALTEAQVKQIAGTGVGERVSTTVPVSAIDLSWSFSDSPDRRVAAAEIPDEAKVNHGEVSLKGTVLYSFNDPMILIQSDDVIYQMDRDSVKTGTPDALNRPGTKIKLTAPVEAVQFMWSTRGEQIQFSQLGSELGGHLPFH